MEKSGKIFCDQERVRYQTDDIASGATENKWYN